MGFISKVELKYQLRKMGIKVEGNYVRKSELANFSNNEIKTKLAQAIKKTEMMLDLVDLDVNYNIYLIGSRASNTETENSDWDFLIVGEDFDGLEDERIALFEEGELPKELALDCPTHLRKDHVDVIFSSTPPKANQPNIKLK